MNSVTGCKFRLEIVKSSITVYKISVNKFKLYKSDDIYILPYPHLWTWFLAVSIDTKLQIINQSLFYLKFHEVQMENNFKFGGPIYEVCPKMFCSFKKSSACSYGHVPKNA
jgi:hypothetical protein